MRGSSCSDEPTSTSLPERRERALAARFRFVHQPEKGGIAAQRVELRAPGECRGHEIPPRDRPLQIAKPGLVFAHVAEQPSFLKNRFRVVPDFQRVERGIRTLMSAERRSIQANRYSIHI